MDNEKIFDAGANPPQEKAADELLSETELAKVAGGVGGSSWCPLNLEENMDNYKDAGSNGH